jgi:predicted phage terminase large subunit-like protein
MAEGQPCLWGDTINSNIDRYVERYFFPVLKYYKIPYKWDSRKKLMTVKEGYTDFRSADRPENWEGFGYKKIFLNEAGIILDDEYLYLNAVLPMMMDFPDSQLIAAGTPKMLKGKGRYFFELWQKAQRKERGYYTKQFSTYDNPFLSKVAIKTLEMEIPSNERRQEIYGDFIIEGGSIVKLAWFQRYTIQPANPTRVIHSWDTASKGKELSDPSVCTVWHEYNRNYYLVDVYRDRIPYPQLKRMIKNLAYRDIPHAILIEDKSSGQSLIEDLRADTGTEAFPFNVVAIEPILDKVTRMSTASLTIEAGRVFIPSQSSWSADYEDEISSFPSAPFDDQADSTSQFLNWIREAHEILIG